jgi:hypothetical protein
MASVLKETLYATGTATRTLSENVPTITADTTQTDTQTHDGSDANFDSIKAVVGVDVTADGSLRVEWPLSALSYTGTIDSIKIIIRGMYVTTANSFRPSIVGAGRGATHGTAEWDTYTDVFTTDPIDSQVWTSTKLAAGTFGYLLNISALEGTAYLRVSEFKVEVWGPESAATSGRNQVTAMAVGNLGWSSNNWWIRRLEEGDDT